MAGLRLPRVNRALLAGRVVKDFTLRYTADETPVATFRLAFNRPVKKPDGSWGEVAGFVDVLVSHRLAELCAERLRKGSPVYLEGRLQTRRWEGPNGRARSVLEIKADQVQFLDRPGESEVQEDRRAEDPKLPREGDLPF
jgi:single-strand DNA-binding protein